MTPGPGIEPRPQRWEDSALISAPFPVLLRPGWLTDYSSNAELAIKFKLSGQVLTSLVTKTSIYRGREILFFSQWNANRLESKM